MVSAGWLYVCVLHAYKPVAESKTDIEALIERLNQYSQSLIACQMGGEFSDVCMEAAEALSTLQDENDKLRIELKSEVDLIFQQAKELNRKNLLLREQEAELEQVKRERDAAIKQLHGNCTACKHFTPKHNEGPCRTCKHEYYHLLNNESLDNWERRGPHKEE